MSVQLVQGETYHRRIGGPDNAFRYSVDYVLSQPDRQERLPFLLSRNGANLASINDRDHGGVPGHGTGTVWVRDVLKDHGLAGIADCDVLLLAQPRVLGHLFNPVSFWLVVDEHERIRAAIAEVNNTVGDRHSYLCHHDDLRPIDPGDTLSAEKLMHVSPFQKVAGRYNFNFDLRPDRVAVRIDYRNGNGGLLATLTGQRKPLTSLAIIGSVIRRPLGSVRVFALILWQAVKLYFKGAPFRRRPAPPASEISR